MLLWDITALHKIALLYKTGLWSIELLSKIVLYISFQYKLYHISPYKLTLRTIILHISLCPSLMSSSTHYDDDTDVETQPNTDFPDDELQPEWSAKKITITADKIFEQGKPFCHNGHKWTSWNEETTLSNDYLLKRYGYIDTKGDTLDQKLFGIVVVCKENDDQFLGNSALIKKGGLWMGSSTFENNGGLYRLALSNEEVGSLINRCPVSTIAISG